MIDNSWLTEEYLNTSGYYKISDDGQYGVYKNNHLCVKSSTYGKLPENYRTITFNRDPDIGVFFSVSADWGTRHSAKNVLATSQGIFEIILNACV